MTTPLLDTGQAAATPASVTASARRRALASVGGYAGVLVALVIGASYLTATQPEFLTAGNLANIVSSNSVTLTLALGSTFVIIAAGLDLSIAAGAAACAMLLGVTVTAGAPTILDVLAPVALGAVIGFVNGALITWGRISFLVVTLGAMSVYTSVALVVKSGATISLFGLPAFEGIDSFATHNVGAVPILLFFDVALAAAAAVVLRYTSFGRSVFAVGSNREAARLNGINVGRIVLLVYTISGLAMGIASVIQVGRLTGAAPTVDPSQLLGVLAAVLIGGTAYSGGAGTILGTVIGVLFLGVVQNGLTLSGVSAFWQGTVNGLILIAAVGLGVLRHRRRRVHERRRVN